MKMDRYSQLLAWMSLSLLLFVGGATAQNAASATGGGAAGPQTAPAESTADKTNASDYVGAETCKTCHEDMPTKGFFKTYQNSPHYVTMLDKKHGPSWHGCEACHGPGRAHVEGGGDKSKIFIFKNASAKEINERCLKCHNFGEEHSNFARSAHMQNNVSCIDCHSPHHPKETQFLMKEKTPQLCYGCHLEAKQQFNRPFHHRVNEGLVNCTDCHNPHGGFLARQLRATAEQDTVCFKCHSEKAGPFVYEHEVVKVEGCTACHTPHGSSNPRLLSRSQVNLVCLDCHAFTVDAGPAAIPTFHNQAQKYQACTMCHTAIHGSNTSSVFFTP
jgi:DmsE family decaheme c-type cytochrome